MLKSNPVVRESFHWKFSPEEDAELRSLAKRFGESHWDLIAAHLPGRSARQCRDRWVHYLSLPVNCSEWTTEEDKLLIAKHSEIGSKWVQIARFFVNRSDAMIKNRFRFLQRRQARAKQFWENYDPILNTMMLAVPANKKEQNKEIRREKEVEPLVLSQVTLPEEEFDSWSEIMESDGCDKA
jgi:hypothetical protein